MSMKMLGAAIRYATAGALAALVMLAAAGTAWAHVEVSPAEVRPGSAEEFVVEVGGEKSEPAVEVRLEVPDDFEVTDVSSPSGWSGEIRGGSVVWSGGEIAEDRIAEFPFEARSPDEAGEFAWKGFVTYGGGDVVAWTGGPDSERPASVVTVASGSGQTGDAGGEDHDEQGGAAAAEAGESHHGSEEGGLPETGGPAPVLALGTAAVLVLVSAMAVRRASRAS